MGPPTADDAPRDPTACSAIPAASVGIVAAERSAFNGNLIDEALDDAPHTASPLPLMPAFLAGRFGPDAVLRTVVPDEQRQLEVGALMFAREEETDPRRARSHRVAQPATAGHRQACARPRRPDRHPSRHGQPCA